MNDLNRNIRHLMSIYGAPGIDVGVAVEDLEQAFVDDGWIPKDVADKSIRVERIHEIGPKLFAVNGQDEIVMPDGTKLKFNPEDDRMSGTAWLDKTLRTIWEHINETDYFRDSEQFRASTITIGELEGLLKRAAGLEEATPRQVREVEVPVVEWPPQSLRSREEAK